MKYMLKTVTRVEKASSTTQQRSQQSDIPRSSVRRIMVKDSPAQFVQDSIIIRHFDDAKLSELVLGKS